MLKKIPSLSKILACVALRPCLCSTPLLLLITLYSITANAEDADVLTLTAGAGWNRDSNLFRTPSDPQSENIRHLTFGANINIPISLQRFVLDATVEDNHYQHFSNIDYQGGNAKGAWNWAVGDRASGNLGYRYQRYLADFGDVQSHARDLVTQRTPFFGLNYSLTPEWQIVGDVSHAATTHSDRLQSALDSRTDTSSAGINYLTPANNSVGFVVRHSDTAYPNPQPVSVLNSPGVSIPTITQVDNSYRENEASAVMIWNLSGVSRLDARLGYTSRKHKELPSRNFGGKTGEMTYHWMPTGSSSVDLIAYDQIKSSDVLSATYILFRGIAIAPTWKPLDTVTLKLRATRELRKYNGEPGAALGVSEQRRDTFRSAQFNAAYAPVKNFELSIAFDVGKRDSNLDSFDYKYKLASAQVKFSF